MNIQDIIDELNSQTYPTDDIQALEQLRLVTETVKCPVEASHMRKYLTQQNKITAIEDLTTTTNPLQDASKAVMITLYPGGTFDLSDAGNLQIIEAYVTAGIINETQKNEIIALSEKTELPFENATLSQLREARGKSNSKTVSGWNAYGAIALDISGELYEQIRPTLTASNQYQDEERLGRTKTITKSGKHVISLDGLVSVGGPSDINIELNAPNAFTVTLIG
jgi:hypothetical protein